MAEHSNRAGAALQRLAERDPAFAVLGLWCRHVDSDARDLAAWSNADTIHYGPAFDNLAAHEQVGLAAHHILHISFRHAPRARRMYLRFGDSFDPEVYTIAADALINETLELAGYALPRPAIRVSELMREVSGKAIAPEDAVAQLDADSLYIRLMAMSPGGSGSAAQADAEARAAQVRAAAEQMGFRQDLEASEIAADADAEESDDFEWRQRLARALDAGRASGRGLGALGFRIADIPVPETPWDVLLRGLLSKAVMQDPRLSWRRPTGRWLAMESAARAEGRPVPVFEPVIQRSREIPRIVVGIDSSGSIDNRRLGLFAAQVAAIGRRTGAEIHVIVFDEEVRAHHRMQGGRWEQQITEIVFSRDGGTDFTEVIERAVALEPSAIVILTDLDGPQGDLVPKVPVIWAVPSAAGVAPPFGRVLDLAR